MDGHLASVSLKFKDKLPEWQDIRQIWDNFSALPQTLDLPTAPRTPITYTEYEDRPQPRLDRDTDKGMTTTVGRLRRCDVLDWKFVGMSHNTIRGAAGGGILNAELLVAHNWVNV
jgi:aspartate-semialdehyde dehydrogenase